MWVILNSNTIFSLHSSLKGEKIKNVMMHDLDLLNSVSPCCIGKFSNFLLLTLSLKGTAKEKWKGG